MEKYLNKEFIIKHKKEIIKIGGALLIIIIALAVYFSGGNKEEAEAVQEETVIIEEKETRGEVIVDICGAVVSEKVVRLPEGSRVEDAINAAGGVTDDADLSYINRAAILTDGEKLYIPTEEEASKGVDYRAYENIETDDSKVNINTADSETLQTLTGIGPVTADKIIEYRTRYGNFHTIEDLMEVNGIGSKTFAQIKDKIKV